MENEFLIFYLKLFLVDLIFFERRWGYLVIEVEGYCLKDVDYIDLLKLIKVCWEIVFLEEEGKIVIYYFFGGIRFFGIYIRYFFIYFVLIDDFCFMLKFIWYMY